MNSLKRRLTERYHWIIAVIVFIQMFVFGGIVNSQSVYLIPITVDLGISRGTYSLLNMVSSLASTLSTIVVAFFFQRFGYRKIVQASLGLQVASFVIAAVSNSLWTLGFSKLLFGLGYGACHTAGATWIVKAWFHKHRGAVMGVVTMATGLGGSLFSVMLTSVMQFSNWRWAYITSGVLEVVIILLFLLLRNAPADMGIAPYGDGAVLTEKDKSRYRVKEWPGISVQETKRHPAYWLICGCVLVSSVCINITFGVVVPHFQDNGYSATAAAQYQSVMMFFVAIAKLFGGWLSEKIGGKAVAILCVGCAAVSQLGLADVSNPVLSYGYVSIFSMALIVTSLVISLMSEAVFGHETSVHVVGLLLGMGTLAGVVASPISNYFFDMMGSYNLLFQIVAFVNVGVMILLLVGFRWFGKKEKQYLREKVAGEV